MKKTFLTRCTLAVLAVLAVLTVAPPAMADSITAKDRHNFAVSKIEYSNKGGYNAKVEIRFKIKNNAGTSYTCGMTIRSAKTTVRRGERQTFDLGTESNYKFRNDNPKACSKLRDDKTLDGLIPRGSEVWVRINIVAGEKKSCRGKNNLKFFYHPQGGKAVFKTGGSTFNLNRCLLKSDGGTLVHYLEDLGYWDGYWNDEE